MILCYKYLLTLHLFMPTMNSGVEIDSDFEEHIVIKQKTIDTVQYKRKIVNLARQQKVLTIQVLGVEDQ